jgi:hypothetical protein
VTPRRFRSHARPVAALLLAVTTGLSILAVPAPAAAAGAPPAALLPFAPDSVWRAALGADARYEAPTDARTARLVAAGNGTWLNAERWSIPVVQASGSDPLVFVDDRWRTDATIRIPAGTAAAAGDDGHLVVIAPDGATADEFFGVQQVAPDRWTSKRHHVTNLSGSGIGPDAGVRAYGGSALGGLVRAWEVDPSHPAYVDGVIRHPLALALPPEVLGAGFVAPATEEDSDAATSYTGNVPMGTRVAIPRSVDLGALGLPPEVLALGRALQDYGAYVVDRASGAAVFYAEPAVPVRWRDAVRGPSSSGGHLARLRSLLRVVVAAGSGAPAPVDVGPFLERLYPDLLGRPIDGAGEAYWAGRIAAGLSRADVAASITNSDEYRTGLLAAAYEQLLDRRLDGAGTAHFLALLRGGWRVQDVQVDLTASDEYWSRAGRTAGGLVDAVYADLLGRVPDAAGRAHWVAALGAAPDAARRGRVAAGIVLSAEALTPVVDARYRTLLGRPGEPAGVAYWIGLIQRGERVEQVIALLAGSDEYLARRA